SELENETVGLYNEEFLDQSENWEVKLHLRELSETWSIHDGLPYEESSITMTYLKEIDESLEFHYKLIYGKPMRMGAGPGYSINLQSHAEFISTSFDQRMIEEVCFGTL